SERAWTAAFLGLLSAVSDAPRPAPTIHRLVVGEVLPQSEPLISRYSRSPPTYKQRQPTGSQAPDPARLPGLRSLCRLPGAVHDAGPGDRRDVPVARHVHKGRARREPRRGDQVGHGGISPRARQALAVLRGSSAAEVVGAHLRIVQQLLAGALEAIAPKLQDEGSVADGQRLFGVLLDNEHR